MGEGEVDAPGHAVRSFVTQAWAHRTAFGAAVVGNVGAALGTLVGGRILTEVATPELFGEYKLALAGISLVTGIALRPVIQFGMRQFHDEHLEGRSGAFVAAFERRFVAYLVVLCAGLSCLGAASAFFSAEKELAATYMLSVAVLGTASTLELCRAWAVTANHQRRASWIGLLRAWCIPPACILGIFAFGQDVHAVLVATVIATLLIEVSQVRFRRQLRGAASADGRPLALLLPDLLRYAGPLSVVGVFNWGVHESDRVLLALLHGEAAVGIYSAAYGVVAAPFIVGLGALAQFAYPLLFRRLAGDAARGERRLLVSLIGFTAAAGAVGVTIVALFANELAVLALGPRFRDAAGSMIWIASGYAFYAIAGLFDLVAYGSKRTLDVLLANVIAALVNVGAAWLLIPSRGALGAAMATFYSLATYLFVMAARYGWVRFGAGTRAP